MARRERRQCHTILATVAGGVATTVATGQGQQFRATYCVPGVPIWSWRTPARGAVAGNAVSVYGVTLRGQSTQQYAGFLRVEVRFTLNPNGTFVFTTTQPCDPTRRAEVRSAFYANGKPATTGRPRRTIQPLAPRWRQKKPVANNGRLRRATLRAFCESPPLGPC